MGFKHSPLAFTSRPHCGFAAWRAGADICWLAKCHQKRRVWWHFASMYLPSMLRKEGRWELGLLVGCCCWGQGFPLLTSWLVSVGSPQNCGNPSCHLEAGNSKVNRIWLLGRLLAREILVFHSLRERCCYYWWSKYNLVPLVQFLILWGQHRVPFVDCSIHFSIEFFVCGFLEENEFRDYYFSLASTPKVMSPWQNQGGKQHRGKYHMGKPSLVRNAAGHSRMCSFHFCSNNANIPHILIMESRTSWMSQKLEETGSQERGHFWSNVDILAAK